MLHIAIEASKVYDFKKGNSLSKCVPYGYNVRHVAV